MLPFLLRGDFDVVGSDLRTEVDSLEDSPEMEKSVHDQLREGVA